MFIGNQEFRAAPKPLTGHEVLERVRGIDCRFGKMKDKKQNKDDNGNLSWKKKSIFFLSRVLEISTCPTCT